MNSSGLAGTQPTRELPDIPLNVEVDASPAGSLFSKMRGPRKTSANHSPHGQKFSVDRVFSILGGQDHMDDDNDTDVSVSSPNSRPDNNMWGAEKVEKICEIGFSQEEAERALKDSNGDLFTALDQLVIDSGDMKRTSPERSRRQAASGVDNFGPVPVITPTKLMGIAHFNVVSSSEKKDLISDLDPDKVIFVHMTRMFFYLLSH